MPGLIYNKSIMFKNMSFRTKITAAMVSVVAVSLIAVMLFVNANLHRELQDYSVSQNLQITTARAEQIAGLIRLVEFQLKMISDRPEFKTGSPLTDQAMLWALQPLLPPEVKQLIWADITGAYTTSMGPADGSLAERPYFKAVVEEDNYFVISEAVISKSLDIPIIVLAVPLHGDDGQTTGLLGAMLSLESLSAVTSQITVGESGYGWVSDATGQILAYPDPEAVMKRNVTDSDKDGYVGLDALGKRMVAGETGWGTFKKPDGVDFATYFCPIPRAPGWTLGLTLPVSEAESTERQLGLVLVFVLLGAVVLALVSAVALGSQLAKPLGAAARQFQELSGADADLTVQLPVVNNDEVGRMVGDFNIFVAKLRDLIRGLKAAQGRLSEIGTELGSTVRESQVAVGTIGTSVGVIRDQSVRQNSSVSQSSAAVEEIAKNIESLDQLIQQQAASIIEGSASVEEMVGNIASIKESAERMSRQFDELSRVIGKVKDSQGKTMTKVQAMSHQSEGLLEANRVIAGISAQTNLLAMNAAIEAAHAGDSGRGFSVVADEIRKLAETSAGQSKSIGQDLKGIQRSIQEILAASHESELAFTQVGEQIVQTETIVRSVKESLSEQQEGSSQMLMALKDMNNVTSEVRSGSEEMRVGNKTILDEIQVLKEGSSAITRTLGQVEDETTTLAHSSTAVEELTARTGHIIAEMEELIGRFKV